MNARPQWTDPGVGFPPASRAAWEQVAREGGATLEKLSRVSEEGLRVHPLYDQADLPPARATLPRATRGWEVLGEHDRPDPAGAADDLRGGADGLHLALAGWGPIRSPQPFLELLSGVEDLGACRISLSPGPDFDQASLHLLGALERRGVSPARARVGLGVDLADGLRAGADPDVWRGRLGALVAALRREWPQVRVARSAGLVWHEAGADATLELGLILAGAVETLRALEAHDGDLQPDALELFTCLDADLYRSVAKLRALRRCWGRVLEALGLDPAGHPARVVARTSRRMLSRRDPWTNSLRATLAATAAATGGADALIVLPFDQALGPPSPRARRLARNTQLVLREEARLHQVEDPWGGSYFMERLSEDLARAAWERLQEVERQGGLGQALRSGWIAARIAESRAAREQRVARRQDALVGVSDWPLPGEPPPPGLSAELAPADAPFAPRRLAEPWEALWLASSAQAARGAPPRVALVALGPLAEHLTRSTWVANLCAAAGIEAPAPDRAGASDAAAAAAAFQASGARVAILCGADARYAELTATVAPALRAVGAARLYQAGAPGEREAEFRAAGVDEFLSAGSDVLAACQRLLAHLGEEVRA